MSAKQKTEIQGVARNRKAFHEFHISDKYEAGIVLTGSEIKSIRQGGVNLKDGFVRIKDGEAWLENVNIAQYQQGGKYFNHEPERVRKLLLKRRQIDQIEGQVSRKGLTVLPLSLYIRDNRAKVEIGLAKSKKIYDKKQDIINREMELEKNREVKRRFTHL